MISIPTHTIERTGTSYEIGFETGKMTAAIPALKDIHASGMEGFGKQQVKEAITLFDRWCPGLSCRIARRYLLIPFKICKFLSPLAIKLELIK